MGTTGGKGGKSDRRWQMGDGRWGVGDEDEDVWTFLICFISCVRVQALDMGVRREEMGRLGG